jgi:hypothetical protein
MGYKWFISGIKKYFLKIVVILKIIVIFVTVKTRYYENIYYKLKE